MNEAKQKKHGRKMLLQAKALCFLNGARQFRPHLFKGLVWRQVKPVETAIISINIIIVVLVIIIVIIIVVRKQVNPVEDAKI